MVSSSLKILHHTTVSPPPSSSPISLPLTSLDLLWLRFHPVERIYFYSLPQIQTSLFLHSIIPKLKHSLSLTLHHFLPLAGRIVWPSHSPRPIIQYTPGGDADSVSLVIAESDSDFNLLSENLPHDATSSRPLIPHLESSDSSASVLSLQITLFPNRGFCIGISTHHAVFDGKSSVNFMKAWAYLCKTQEEQEENSSLLPKLKPFFEREAIIESYSRLEDVYRDVWINTKLDPNPDKNRKIPRLNILDAFKPNLDESSVRATFELKREDLEKLKRSIASDEEERVSTFVVTTAYVFVCAAKAIERCEKKKKKYIFTFSVDCRARLEQSVPENYFGNCVMLHIGEEFSEEDGVSVVAKKVKNKVREIVEEKGVLDGAETLLHTFPALKFKGFEVVGVAGSTQFGVYETDFGWGRPEKVEITSVDRGLAFGMAESRDGNGGVEVGVVLNRQLMDCFASLFHTQIDSL